MENKSDPRRERTLCSHRNIRKSSKKPRPRVLENACVGRFEVAVDGFPETLDAVLLKWIEIGLDKHYCPDPMPRRHDCGSEQDGTNH